MRAVLAVAITSAVSLFAGAASAMAQDPGLGGILGGYGAMSADSGSAMGGGFMLVEPSAMGGTVMVPFASGIGSSMAPGMERGAGLSFLSRPAQSMVSRRLSFSIDSMGAMPRMAGGMGVRRPFRLSTGTLSGGMGLGGGVQPMPATSSMGVMPPSFGYPFRQPARLLGPSSSGMGMSM